MSAADMVAAALEKSYRASDIPWSQLTSLQGKRDRLLCSCLREKLPWAPSLDSSRNTPARDALSALARAVKRNEGALHTCCHPSCSREDRVWSGVPDHALWGIFVCCLRMEGGRRSMMGEEDNRQGVQSWPETHVWATESAKSARKHAGRPLCCSTTATTNATTSSSFHSPSTFSRHCY